MRTISKKLKDEMASDEYYQTCCRTDEGNCKGRITYEHAIIHAGKQLNEKWAILPVCEYHHDVNTYQGNGDLNKQKHIKIALNRATDKELEKISKAIDYKKLRNRLNDNKEL